MATEFEAFEGFDDVWRYDQFITTIQHHAGISGERAERAARAVLETLSERISEGEALDLSLELPGPLRRWIVAHGGDAQSFDAEEFIRRVARREAADAGVDPEAAADVGEALQHARAVFVALSRLVRGSEIEDLAEQLGRGYHELLGRRDRLLDRLAPRALPYDEFVRRVLSRARSDDHELAERAVDAALETLGERIVGREVEDILEVLPRRLHPPLARALERTGGKAMRMTLDVFVGRIAERLDLTPAEALPWTRAVLTTLREALPSKEFDDLVAELPADYRPLFEDGGAWQPPKAVTGEPVTTDEFVRRVAEHGRLEIDEARHATEAVLETLAERVSGGEVRDLERALPAELVNALERGKQRVHGTPRRLSLDEFVGIVAAREGVEPEVAFAHAAAVLETLNDVLPGKELHDLRSELPRAYVEALL